MFWQKNSNKEIEITKRNQIEILKLKSIITEMKNSLWGSIAYLIKEKKQYANVKIGQLKLFSLRCRNKINEEKETLRYTWYTIEHMGFPEGKKRKNRTEELQDGKRVRRGDHLPPHKHIRNTSTCGTTPTENLLNAGRRPQTSQKARNTPTYLGRAKEKRINRDKRIGTGPAPLGGSCEGGTVSTH